VIHLDPAQQSVPPIELVRGLERHNIEARPVWRPMHTQPLFAGAEVVGGDVADELFTYGLCLPSSSSLASADQDRVIDALRAMLTLDVAGTRGSATLVR
jgi:dTDP-4-amino-4,6-dideoxygalactose transaminase